MCSLACPQITRLTQGMKYDQIKLKKLGVTKFASQAVCALRMRCIVVAPFSIWR